jgi:putative mRNA 3-end processing factor
MEGMDAQFTKEEIERVERYSFPIGYKKKIPVSENSSLEFFDAGHISGSALSKLSLGEKEFLYTGDFRVKETRLHSGADLKVGHVDYCVIEGTYGNRLHPERQHSEKHFVESVQEIVENGGWALVPAFAVGRSQEVVDILNEYNLGVPIYLDGMCQKAANILLKYPDYLKNPFYLKKALDNVEWIKNDRMRAKAMKQPSVIVTTSGMLTGGPIMQYVKRLYKNKDSKIFLTGYQVEGTPGRTLLETNKLPIDGAVLDIEMQVEKFDFSAHADQAEMILALKKWSPEKVIIVHGDRKVILEFQAKLKEEGFDAVAAETEKTIKLH